MQNPKWLAVFIDEHGQIGAAMVSPNQASDFPFGIDVAALGIHGADGGVAFVEMPSDPDFRPMVVDCDRDDEVAIQFIDLEGAA